MPDEIPTPQDKEPETIAAAEPAAPAKAKPKKKKPAAKAKKKVVTAAPLVSDIKPQTKPAPKPLKKKEPTLLFTQSKPERKPERASAALRVNGKFIPMLAVLLIVVVVGAFAWNKAQKALTHSEQTATDLRTQVDGEVSGLKNRLQQLADELQAQKQKEQQQAFIDYRNDDIGVAFRYPQTLGQIQEKVDDVDGKKTLSLTFTSNPDLWLVASVADHDADNAFIYDGSEQNLAARCKQPLIVTENGYCDLISVMGMQTVEEVRPIGEDTLLNVVKTVPLNVASGAYSGLTVNVGLGLPPVTGRDLFAAPEEQELQASLEQFYRNLIKREQLSLVVRENLNAFQSILTSMQVVAKGS